MTPRKTLESELKAIPEWLNNRKARRARASIFRRMKKRESNRH